jgi:hypothetical protein
LRARINLDVPDGETTVAVKIIEMPPKKSSSPRPHEGCPNSSSPAITPDRAKDVSYESI